MVGTFWFWSTHFLVEKCVRFNVNKTFCDKSIKVQMTSIKVYVQVALKLFANWIEMGKSLRFVAFASVLSINIYALWFSKSCLKVIANNKSSQAFLKLFFRLVKSLRSQWVWNMKRTLKHFCMKTCMIETWNKDWKHIQEMTVVFLEDSIIISKNALNHLHDRKKQREIRSEKGRSATWER